MAKPLTLIAQKRELSGRRIKSLRRQKIIPANVYGAKIKSFAVQITESVFQPVYLHAGETGLINLTIEGSTKPHPVLITHVQKHPVSDAIIHVDFREVILSQKVTATIEVDIIGDSPAVKDLAGVLVVALNNLEVEALPTDLPDKFTVDISTLKAIGDSILVKDLKYDKSKVTLSVDPEDTVVTIKPQEEEIVEEAPAPAEVETTETPTEGEPAEKPEDGNKPAVEEPKPEPEK